MCASGGKAIGSIRRHLRPRFPMDEIPGGAIANPARFVRRPRLRRCRHLAAFTALRPFRLTDPTAASTVDRWLASRECSRAEAPTARTCCYLALATPDRRSTKDSSTESVRFAPPRRLRHYPAIASPTGRHRCPLLPRGGVDSNEDGPSSHRRHRRPATPPSDRPNRAGTRRTSGGPRLGQLPALELPKDQRRRLRPRVVLVERRVQLLDGPFDRSSMTGDTGPLRPGPDQFTSG